MRELINRLLDSICQPRLVEFDYFDDTGSHHGCCYVRCLFGGQRRIAQYLRSYGYFNVRVTR